MTTTARSTIVTCPTCGQALTIDGVTRHVVVYLCDNHACKHYRRVTVRFFADDLQEAMSMAQDTAFEKTLQEWEQRSVSILVEAGVPEADARKAQQQITDGMGLVHIQRGTCPLHARSTIACTFCSFGHMFECHHPHTCREANSGRGCGHHRGEI